jgi:signal transduction histidine kinase
VSLRATLFVFLAAVGAYVLVIAGYLYLRVAPAADELRRTNEPALVLFTQLTARTTAIGGAVKDAHHLAEATPAERARLTAGLRAQLGAIRNAGQIETFGAAPPHLLGALARAHDGVTRLENLLYELVALIELGRLEEARRAEPSLDSLEREIAATVTEAQRLGTEDLIEREREFAAATRGAVRDVLVWIGAGLVLIPLAVLLTRRRVALPLARIQSGLNTVAEGNLNVTVPVERDDEMGRLAAHFNEMTRVIRERAEEQGRFAATGELLAGVAHEVNNPLMAISALAENQLEDPAHPPEVRADLGLIVRHARRAGKLVSGLLRFVRPAEAAVRDFAPGPVVEAAVALVGFRLGVNEITLTVDLPPDLALVRGHRARFEQVLVNLLSNAIDEVAGGLRPRSVRIGGRNEGDRVVLEVKDSGRGLAPEMRDRLFRPFVTTKGKRGNGLGLYISRAIMREMGGDLELRSGPGEGACFALWLPASPERVPSTATGEFPVPSRATPPSPLTGVRILIADDEDGLRGPLVRYLNRQGAAVLEARDGAEALEMIATHEFDVVVADLRMPRVSGLELYQRLLEIQPALAERVLFLSGDLAELSESDGPVIPQERLLAKPIELAELRARIMAIAPPRR